MRLRAALLMLICASSAGPALAQDPPPPIPRVVVDLHGTMPRFPSDDPQLAESRNLNLVELPGAGLGAQIGLHFYPLRTRVVTFGVGGELAIGREQVISITDEKMTVDDGVQKEMELARAKDMGLVGETA